MFVESLGFCVLVQVYSFLPGVGRCVGLAGLIVGVGVARGEGLHVSKGDLSGEGGFIKWPAIDSEFGGYALLCPRAFFRGEGAARRCSCRCVFFI